MDEPGALSRSQRPAADRGAITRRRRPATRRLTLFVRRVLRRLSPVRLVALGAAVMILALSGLIGTILLRGYNQDIAEAEHRVSDFTDLLVEHTARIFDGIDRTLEISIRMRESLIQAGTWGETAGDRPYAALRELLQSSAAVANLSWVDAQGERLYTALTRYPPPRNVAEHPQFRVHRDDDGVGLYVGPPSLSALTGKYLIPVSRRISAPNGDFLGIANAFVDPSYFATTYQAATRRQRLVIRVMLRDGTLIIREPSRPGIATRSLAQNPLFTRYLLQSPSGIYRHVSNTDGIERIISYRAIDKLPLVVSVGMSRGDALAQWRAGAGMILGFYAALVCMIAAGAWLLIAQLRQRARRLRELAAAKERLRRAQKLEALGTLAGGVAHEINNAVMPIMAYGEITLRDLPPESPERANVAKMVDAGGKIAKLVERILAMSRQEQAERRPIDLAHCLGLCLDAQRARLPQNISLVVDIDAKAGMVLASPGQIKQVLDDLVGNAADAIGTQAGRIEIGAGGRADVRAAFADRDARRYVCVTVSDDGPGMTPEVQARLFEPFFTTKQAGSGVGLGLYAVRRILVELGGFIEVDSAPARGTSVAIYLPRAVGRPDIAEAA